MRGYFSIGIEGVSKAGNMGNLIRTAHGFGAAFVFTIAQKMKQKDAMALAQEISDTSKTPDHIPYYEFDRVEDLLLPKGCQLVGVEITDDALEMPSFRHPLKAAYILGSEMFSVSAKTLKKCDHVIKIPTKFSLNVATAGAIVMYDRLLCYGKFRARPVTTSGKAPEMAPHVQGMPRQR